jgi:guanosine-3',5'-bis(diphosphate) 3'-pyrophosphohydrolase
VIEVAELLARIGGVTDPITLQAAILHDIVEDTPVTFADVERGFGRDVRRIVEEVTDDKQLPKSERKQIQVDKAPGLSTAAKMIKIADKTSNVQAIMLSPPPIGRASAGSNTWSGRSAWSPVAAAPTRGSNSTTTRW